MAALSSPTVNTRLPCGRRFLVTGTVAVTTSAGHVPTAKLQLAAINAVVGCHGAATANVSVQAMPNTQTQATANLNYGDLSLDTSSNTTLAFSVIGR